MMIMNFKVKQKILTPFVSINMKTIIGVLSVISAVFLLILYGIVSWGYVSHTLYLWFIQPHFPELPMFSIYTFIGFMFFSSVMFKGNHVTNIKSKFKDESTMYVGLIINPWIILLVAWIFKSTIL